MKKVTALILIVIFVLSTIVCVNAETDYASFWQNYIDSNQNILKSDYYQFVDAYVLDMENDNIPELLTIFTDGYGTVDSKLYGISGNNVIELKTTSYGAGEEPYLQYGKGGGNAIGYGSSLLKDESGKICILSMLYGPELYGPDGMEYQLYRIENGQKTILDSFSAAYSDSLDARVRKMIEGYTVIIDDTVDAFGPVNTSGYLYGGNIGKYYIQNILPEKEVSLSYSKKTYQEAYYNVIENAINKYGNYRTINNMDFGVGFAKLIDFEGDNVPELMLGCIDPNINTYEQFFYLVYGYDGEKAYEIARVTNSKSFERGVTMGIWNGHNGKVIETEKARLNSGETYFGKVINGKWSNSIFKSELNNYYYNGTYVSKETYYDKLNQYRGTSEAYEYNGDCGNVNYCFNSNTVSEVVNQLKNKINAPIIKIKLNGNELSFDQPPIMQNDRTLVPIRAIFEALGATVEWNDNTQTVTATKGNIIVNLSVNKCEMYKNGEVIWLDVPPTIKNGRTLVPVRAVTEAFDCTVRWDEDSKTVCIENGEDTDEWTNFINNEVKKQSYSKQDNTINYGNYKKFTSLDVDGDGKREVVLTYQYDTFDYGDEPITDYAYIVFKKINGVPTRILDFWNCGEICHYSFGIKNEQLYVSQKSYGIVGYDWALYRLEGSKLNELFRFREWFDANSEGLAKIEEIDNVVYISLGDKKDKYLNNNISTDMDNINTYDEFETELEKYDDVHEVSFN